MRFRLWILRRRFANLFRRMRRVKVIAALGNSVALLLVGTAIIFGVFQMIPKQGYVSFDVSGFEEMECSYYSSYSNERIFTASYNPTQRMYWHCVWSYDRQEPLEMLVFCDGIWIEGAYYPAESIALRFSGSNWFDFWEGEADSTVDISYSNIADDCDHSESPEPDGSFRVRVKEDYFGVYMNSSNRASFGFSSEGAFHVYLKLPYDLTITLDDGQTFTLDGRRGEERIAFRAEPDPDRYNQMASVWMMFNMAWQEGDPTSFTIPESPASAGISMNMYSDLLRQYELRLEHIADISFRNTNGILKYTGGTPQTETFQPHRQDCAFFAPPSVKRGDARYYFANNTAFSLEGTLDTLNGQLKGTFADVLLSGNSLTPTFSSWIYGNYGAVVLAVISALFGGSLLAFKRREK